MNKYLRDIYYEKMKNIFGIAGMDVIMAPGAEAGYLREKINLEKSIGCEGGRGLFFWRSI
jgi:hypothetical protein